MKRIRVGAAAKILGVSVDAIRLWDRAGILKPSFTSPGGQRYYDEEKIREIAKAGRLSDPKDKDEEPLRAA